MVRLIFSLTFTISRYQDNNYEERYAIVELEIYRGYIEKYLLGENIEPSILLGMAFKSQENIIFSPEKDYILVFKGELLRDKVFHFMKNSKKIIYTIRELISNRVF